MKVRLHLIQEKGSEHTTIPAFNLVSHGSIFNQTECEVLYTRGFHLHSPIGRHLTNEESET
jgi:hypothetical protein